MKYFLSFLLAFAAALPVSAAQLTFRVDMRGQTVAPAGVHVAGNFQNEAGFPADWNPATTALTDADQDSIYELTVTVPTGLYFYKFVNGNAWAGAEIVPATCGLDDGGGNFNRTVTVGTALTETPIVPFGSCAPGTTPGSPYATHWWNDAVFYEVFVRSFYDGNGDGRGDFAGLTAKLDYLNDGDPTTTTDLGVTALWLMPMMESPSYHGYDVTNYKATEPDYGTLAQFDAFLAAAHARGIKVIIDLVLNHTSEQHPWFRQSSANTSNSYRDWYVWAPTNNGQIGPWGQTLWYPRGSQYYYSVFWSGMPDLNWRNPQVKTEMWDAARFWINRGVDGYRLDAAKYLVENGQVILDTPETLAVLEEFNTVVKTANPQAFTVGEVWSATATVPPYVVNDRLDVCFEFDLALAIMNGVNSGNATALRNQLNLVEAAYPKLQYAPFLTNHDNDRVMGVLNGDVARMKQAAALYLTMPGVPFMYYGEEVGMLGAGADENKRLPMQWSTSANAGFSTGPPWRAPNTNYSQFNVTTMAADPASLLNHYKKLIGLRHAQEALRKGYLLPVTTTTPATLLSYARIYQQEAVIVASNFGAAAANPALSLPTSSLPAGTYQATDLWTGQTFGTVTIDAQGGFQGWAPAALASRDTWVIRLQVANGLTEIRPALALQLYPNPSTGLTRLQLPTAPTQPAQVRIYDLTGRLVHTARFSGADYALDTRAWATGTYFVRLEAGNAVGTERLVVTGQ